MFRARRLLILVEWWRETNGYPKLIKLNLNRESHSGERSDPLPPHENKQQTNETISLDLTLLAEGCVVACFNQPLLAIKLIEDRVLEGFFQ